MPVWEVDPVAIWCCARGNLLNFFFLLFETDLVVWTKVGFGLKIFLAQPLECWFNRYALSCLASVSICFLSRACLLGGFPLRQVLSLLPSNRSILCKLCFSFCRLTRHLTYMEQELVPSPGAFSCVSPLFSVWKGDPFWEACSHGTGISKLQVGLRNQWVIQNNVYSFTYIDWWV